MSFPTPQHPLPVSYLRLGYNHNHHLSKISSVFSCHPLLSSVPLFQKFFNPIQTSHSLTLSYSSLMFDPHKFSLSLLPGVDPRGQHCNCLSALALCSWFLFLSHILSLFNTTLPTPPLHPVAISWRKHGCTDCTHFLWALSAACKPIFLQLVYIPQI